MLTVPDAARRTGRNPETIRRWIRAGRLRSVKIGTQHMIDEHDLDAVSLPPDHVAVPEAWRRTQTGEPMPDVVATLRRHRAEH